MEILFKEEQIVTLIKNEHRSNEAKDTTLVELFKCIKCGIEPKVIKELWIEGNDNLTIIQLINFLPDTETVRFSFGDLGENDGRLCELLSCGKCGSTGCREKIPKFITEMLDFSKIKKLKEA
ncbi:MAG: hypothetical protein H8E55_66145 [Pelagibacterales bacterium]|nr:hypothetical protein [Pelagibacterales bacterium]